VWCEATDRSLVADALLQGHARTELVPPPRLTEGRPLRVQYGTGQHAGPALRKSAAVSCPKFHVGFLSFISVRKNEERCVSCLAVQQQSASIRLKTSVHLSKRGVASICEVFFTEVDFRGGCKIRFECTSSDNLTCCTARVFYPQVVPNAASLPWICMAHTTLYHRASGIMDTLHVLTAPFTHSRIFYFFLFFTALSCNAVVIPFFCNKILKPAQNFFF
jgi:hypothetical protein